MVTEELKVVPLVCPDCGRGLLGLRYDKVFFCMSCMQGLYPPARGQWERFPASFPKLDENSMQPSFYLPFWEIKIKVDAVAASRQQQVALKKLEDLDTAWVTGFSVIRASYYGDLGLLYTEKRIRLEPGPRPARAFITGCSRTVLDVTKYVELLVTLILDKRADVTGMELDIKTTGAKLWGVPFLDRGDKVADLVTGAELPVFAIDDLEDVKRVYSRR